MRVPHRTAPVPVLLADERLRPVPEGKTLLQPLLASLQKLRTDAATRATRKKAAPAAPAPATAPSSPQ
ncbi:MAG: hypothetical protein IT372_05720 [Polyangiaceae bacterium]|nr:hypothetical protein [Polyangiaceae bacterium]